MAQVYLFGCTEPQMIPLGEDRTEVLPIPVIVAVRTEEPLPEKLGLNSVQMSSEQVTGPDDGAPRRMAHKPRARARTRAAASAAAGHSAPAPPRRQVVDMATYKMGWNPLPVPRPAGRRVTGQDLRRSEVCPLGSGRLLQETWCWRARSARAARAR